MRDIQIWIYVIIGVIYFINRLRKKKADAPTEQPEPSNDRRFEQPTQSAAPPQKGLTFEELLREITEGKAPAQPAPTFKPSPRYVDYDEDLEEEEKDLEEITVDYRQKDKAFYDTYEKAKKDAFNRPSLEETMKVTDTNMKFGKFKEFDQEEQSNVLNDYIAQLKDPEGFKKAFILSEVLQRKY